MNEYLIQILTYFRNLSLNATGVRRDFYNLIQDKDIEHAISMMQNNDSEVDAALQEYNPQTHEVMKRPNKKRRKLDDYKTEKLPRTRQRYINEVELFFLLGHPLIWKKVEGDDDAYALFKDFLDSNYMNSKLRKLKRLAGSETEAALVFRLHHDDDGKLGVDSFIAARSTGYRVRTLFDQYGNLQALAYGYYTKESNGVVQHWDILTKDMNFECRKGRMGWEVRSYQNIVGKICAIYAKQPKAWDGAEQRLKREEFLDSKVADTNNYFADPIAAATADVVQMMQKNDQSERIGTFIQLNNKDSHFGYINPPQNSETRRDEKADLERSILFDTFTPDFSLENMKGFGTLTGVAIKNAMILGYIKRANRMETWQELIDRMRNVILAVLAQLHPDKQRELADLKIKFEFAEPFESDKRENWTSIAQLYQAGLVSLEQAVTMLALSDAPEGEINKLRTAAEEAHRMQMEEKGNGLPAEA